MNAPEFRDWGKFAETGLYTVPLAARLVAAKPEKVRSWLESYPHSHAEPIIHRQLPRVGGKAVLGFLDLIETLFIRHFRAMGYSPQTIRKVAKKLRDRHDVEHPFATDKRFRADGKFIFEEVIEDDGERRLLNLMNDNFEIGPVVEPSLFDQIFYIEDIAREWTPMPERFPDVVVKPSVAFGRPVVRGIWIPTETLFQSALVEGAATEAAEEYGVAVDYVNQAVGFEKELDKRTVH